MADKRIQYTLGFTADTAKAKAQIKDLQNQLNNLSKTTVDNSSLNFSTEIQKSLADVTKLQTQLKNATNVKTGKLDLSKFNQSLQDSGKQLSDYRKSFEALGPQGTKAFLSLTNSILNAEMPLKRTNKLLDEMKTSLSNTIKWQISSSAVHGFMGAIQGAYGYAQDLNKSLNNIRIVTGQSTDDMAKFARQANNAAKALSTTTVKYTDAALIYYQQGLNDEQVKARTDATIKMANVTGENATDVSSYMTAIWNNFAKGSNDLEYFADVITALGAATAASSEEIAGGLEKFAAVGETVGLSYEYATAALTTIIDKTRQSEDVVGTALKTIFARIQGLQQGETAEDGVTLNKYSSALANVGIQIMDTSGNLKEMDKILDELGQKWTTLSKAEQVALAQTVGGTRQYTQLIALMENWGAMQDNLNTAYNSSGALNEQAEIYAESWEAAKNEVTAALQDIYDSLLNDKFFIGITNIFADLLNLVGDLIDSFGGFAGILSMTSGLVFKLFGKEILKGVKDFSYNLNPEKRQKEALETKQKAIDETKLIKMSGATEAEGVEADNILQTAELQETLLKNAYKLTEEEKEYYQAQLDINKALQDRAVLTTREAEKAEEERVKAERKMDSSSNKSNSTDYVATKKSFKEAETAVIKGQNTLVDLGRDTSQRKYNLIKDRETGERFAEGSIEYQEAIKNRQKASKELEQLIKKFDELDKGKSKKKFANISKELQNLSEKIKDPTQDVSQLEDKIDELLIETDKAEKKMRNSFISKMGVDAKEAKNYVEQLGDEITKTEEKENSIKARDDNAKGLKTDLDTKDTGDKVYTTGEQFMAAAEMVASFTAAVTSLSQIWDVWLGDAGEDMTFLEKIGSTFASLTGAVMALSFAFTAENIAKAKSLTGTIAAIPAKISETAATIGQTIATEGLSFALKGATASLYAFLAPFAPILAAALAVSVALAALSAAFKWLKDNSPEGKLKKANEELENAKTAAQNANTEYTNLLNTLNGFEDSYDKIKSLTKYTQEWYDAVHQLNSETSELIKKYGLIEGEDWYYDADGVQRLTKSGHDKATQQEAANKNKANDMVNAASKNKRDAELESTKWSTTYGGIAEKYAQAQLDGSAPDLTDVDATKKWYSDNNLIYSDASVKALQEDKDVLSYIDQYKRAKRADVMDSQSALTDTDIYKDIYGENSSIDNDTKDDYFAVVGEDFNKKRNEYIKNGVTISDKEKEAYEQEFADANDLIYENGKFYTKDEDGNKDKNVTSDKAETVETYIETQEAKKDFIADYDKNKDGYLKDAEARRTQQEKTLGDVNQDESNKAYQDLQGFDKDQQEDYKDYLEYLKETYPELKDKGTDMAERISSANVNFNKGLEDLIDNFDGYYNTLKNSDKKSLEYAKALTAVREDMAAMLDLDPSVLSDEFLTSAENLELMKQAANGNYEAMTQLRENAAHAIVADIEVNGDEEAKAKLDALKLMIANSEEFEKLEIGATLDDSEFINSLNSLISTSNMTVEEAQKVLNSLGFEPTIDYEEVDLKSAQDSGQTVYMPDPNEPGKYIQYDSTIHTGYTGKVYVPKINGSKTVYKGSPKAQASAENKGKIAKKNSGGSKKDKKKASDEIERYHEETRTLSTLEKQLDRISKAKDKAFGIDKLKLMDEEIAKYEEMAAAQQDMIDAVKANYDKDRSAAASIGAQFDPDTGEITNWEELRKKALDKFNNSGRTEKDEEEYNRIKEILDQYEETHDKLMEEEDKLKEYLNSITDAKIAKIQYKAEVKIDFEDKELEYLEYLLSRIEDKAFSTAEAMANLSDQAEDWLDKYNIKVEELYDMMKLFEGMTLDDAIGLMTGNISQERIKELGLSEDQVKKFQELGSDFIDIANGINAVKEAMNEKLTEAIDEGLEKFGDLGDEINHVAGTLEHYRNLIDIIGQDALGISAEQMIDLMGTAVDNGLAAYQNSLSTIEYLNNSRQDILARMANASEEEKAVLQKELDDLDKKIRDAEANSQQSLESYLNMVKEEFSIYVQQAAKEFEKAVSGTFGSLDALQEAFDRQKTLDDTYLDDYKQIYELTKLTRDISKSMDEVDGIKGKQALKKLQQEINDLQKEGVKLSEYDLNHLRAKYELELAQIALEDAQNAKSQVRMTRDSEGNWSYTYTADEDSIANAEQAYEDKLYAMQEMNQEYIKNLEGQLIQSMSAMSKAIQELGPQATQEQIQATMNFYRTQQEQIQQQMNNALGDGKDIWNYMENYNAATGYGITSNEAWVDSFDETQFSILTGFETLEEYQAAFGTSVNTMMNGVDAAFNKYGERLKEAGIDTENWKNKLDETLNGDGGVKDQIEDFEKESEELVTTTTENVGKAIAELGTFYDELGKKMEDATGKTWGLEEAIKALQDAEPKEEPKPATQQQQQTGSGNTSSWEKVKSGYDAIHTGQWGNGNARKTAALAAGFTEQEYQLAQKLINLVYGGMSMSDAKKALGFASGGYTGAWGTAGKLAFLHEKELVLNAEDTQNMLKSIEMVRAIAQTIDLNSGSTLGWGGLSSMGVGNGKSEIVQDITINAEFPNATDQNEIKAAFDSLFIRASQYANRK